MRAVLDGHNDVLLQLWRHGGSLQAGLPGHVDLPKARAGGLAGGFFACFVPPQDGEAIGAIDLGPDGSWALPYAGPIGPAYALEVTLAMVGRLLAAEREGAVTVVRDVGALEAALAGETLAAILHLEGCEAIDPGLERLDVLHAVGLRSVGPVWSRPNAFGHGVPFAFPSGNDVGPGLSAVGKALVDRCGERGIMVDLAHLNARGFWDVAERSAAPLVSTHAGCHALTPTARNLTDEQLDAIGASGGVVGINLSASDIRADGADDPAYPLERWCEHAEHVAARIGAEHVAIGSDFDGATIPDAVGDASGTHRLLDALAARGWTAEQLDGVASRNYVRVLSATWASTA